MTTPFPPIPDVQPAGSGVHWAVLRSSVVYADPFCQISCQTDVPCTLYMNATLEAPGLVRQYRIFRGSFIETIPVWRSKSGLWIRQLQLEDDTTHTFALAGWPPGVNVWYYFDGYIKGGVTISSSILFGSLRPLPVWNPALNLNVKPVIPADLTRTVLHGLVQPPTITPV